MSFCSLKMAEELCCCHHLFRPFFIEVMDSVLSIQSYIQAGYGSESDFHFFNGLDLMEEDAINEKCCLEVLKNLIAKADSEILQLEDDMAVIQSLLKLAEHDKCGEMYEVWCAAFKEKINSLNLSIDNLRNEKFFGLDVLSAELVMHRQPAQRISAIIGTLLRHHFPEDHEQVRDLPFGEKVLADNSLTNSDTEVKGPDSDAIAATSDASNSERKTIPERGTEHSTFAEESNLGAESGVTTDFNDRRNAGTSDVRLTGKDKVSEYRSTCGGGPRILLSSLVFEKNENHLLEEIKGLNNTSTSRSVALQRMGRDEDAKRSEVIVMGQTSSSLYAKKEETKVGVASDDNIKLATLCSLAKLKDHDIKVLKECEPQSTDIPIAKIAISDMEPIANLMLKPQGLKRTRKLQTDLGSTVSLGSPHAEIRRNSLVKERKKQQRHRGPTGHMMTPASEPKMQILCGVARGRISNAASNSKTARGMDSNLVELPEMKDSAASSEFENKQGVASNGDSLVRIPSFDVTPNIRLLSSQEPPCFHNLTLNQLKGIAKQHNVKGYAKLKKSLLAELLAKLLGE